MTRSWQYNWHWGDKRHWLRHYYIDDILKTRYMTIQFRGHWHRHNIDDRHDTRHLSQLLYTVDIRFKALDLRFSL